MKLTPRLIVRGADRAIAFYQNALGAQLLERFVDPMLGDQVVHAALRLGDSVLAVAEEHEPYRLSSAESLGGSPVLLSLEVEDADAVADAMVEAGAQIVLPIEDRFYGKREGRVQDPFGLLWILSQPLETLDTEEISRRMARSHE